MTKLKFNHMLALASTMALMSGSQTVYSQTQPAAADMEEVVVTGFRRSIQDSISSKRESTSIVEAVYAEDIGKLPDSSIAESLARLPGIAAQRLDGRASGVAVRGLSEEFTSTTLNGREQVSLGDNRGVEFDVYPSEIMSGVVVYKTPEASLMSSGMGGTIDMQTVKPLSQSDRIISVSARAEKNDIGNLNPDGDDKGHRITASYIDQFADDTIGVAIAINAMTSPNNEKRWNAWDANGTWPQIDVYNDDPDEIQSMQYVLQGAKPFVRSSMLDRTTVMGVFEFQPDDALHVTVDVMNIDFEDEKILRGAEIAAKGGDWTGSSVTPTGWSGGFVQEGIISNTKPVLRNDFEVREADLGAYGINVEFTPSDTLTLEADLSHSTVEKETFSLESYSGTGRGNGVGTLDDIGFRLTGNSVMFDPSLDYSNYNLVRLGGPLNWGNPVFGDWTTNEQDGFLNMPELTDEITALKLAAEFKFENDFISSVETGINYSTREKDRFDEGLFLTLEGYFDEDNQPVSGFTQVVPEEYRVGTVDLGFIGMGNMIAYDSAQMFRDGMYRTRSERETTTGRHTGTWTVTEDVATLFAKVNIETELFGAVPLRGNVGVQYIQTEQSSDSSAIVPGDGGLEIVPISRDADYDNVLPSVNLIFDVAEGQTIRVGYAQSATRSRMDRINTAMNISYDAINRRINGSGGNTELEPLRADHYDISYENYFSDDGYYSAALFVKDIKDWQQQLQTDFDPTFLTDAFPGLPVDETRVSVWQNAGHGKIEGLELATSLPGNLISESLDGFGVLLSATYLQSELKLDGGMVDDIPVPGLSDRVINSTFFYEKSGFNVRLSVRDRTDFLGEVSAISFTRALRNVQGEKLVDAQIGYDFSESNVAALDGLSLTLQAQNITDQPFTTTVVGNDGLVLDHQIYGANYLLGASYKF